jgi:hypothetical protein
VCYLNTMSGAARREKIDKRELYARERLENSPLKLAAPEKKKLSSNAKAELNASSLPKSNTPSS